MSRTSLRHILKAGPILSAPRESGRNLPTFAGSEPEGEEK